MAIHGMYEKYRDVFDFARRMIAKASDVLVGSHKRDLSVGITMYHCSRAIKLVASVRMLCLKGYASEAEVLLRSLFNLYINLKWLTQKDVECRMERYADFEAVNRFLAAEACMKYGASSPERDTEMKKIKKEMNKVRRKYKLKTRRHLYSWSGKSISAMAKEVSLQEQYEILYRKFSELEHTGPFAVRGYLSDSNPDTITLMIAQTEEGVPLTLLTGVDYLMQIINASTTVIDLEWKGFMRNYKRLQLLIKKCS